VYGERLSVEGGVLLDWLEYSQRPGPRKEEATAGATHLNAGDGDGGDASGRAAGPSGGDSVYDLGGWLAVEE
jgi:hypothetical protein